MPHKSRLTAFVLDCNTPDLVEAARFWSAAFGKPVKEGEDPATEKYVKLDTKPDELVLLLQKVSHPSRVHLDIESDDIEAEVARLEQLGAKRIEKIETWWVMEAPTGHRFCVVRPQRGPDMADANQW
jgi:predicted enzyme related to lactoylglutathione lyase